MMKRKYIKDLDRSGRCPDCNANWDNGDIYQTFRNMPEYKDKSNEEIEEDASMYGWSKTDKKHFSRLIGIEIRGKYDGVLYWQCPDCKTMFSRFENDDPYGRKIN